MKKTLLFLIVAVTALFFGGNTNELNAATTEGVYYVTEGNRIYVHLDAITNETDHSFVYTHQALANEFGENEYGEAKIYFDLPEGTSSFKVEHFDDISEEWQNYEYSVYNFNTDMEPYILSDYNDTTVGDSFGDYILYESIPQNTKIRIFFEFQVKTDTTYAKLTYVNDRAYITASVNDSLLLDLIDYVDQEHIGTITVPDNATDLIIENESNEVIFNSNSVDEYDNGSPVIFDDFEYIDIIANIYGVNICLYSPSMIVIAADEGYGVRYEGTNIDAVYVYFTLDNEDTTEPIIEGQAIISPIHNPFTMEQVKAQITASDDVDGDLTDSIVYEGGTYEAARLADELTINTTYTMTFSVTDTAGNKTTRSIDVIVKDIQVPYFGISNTTIDVEYWDGWNAELFIPQLLVFDAYDSNPTVTVISNEFETINSLDPQVVVYEATDASGNKSRITITLNKVDLLSPDFGGGETEFDVPFLTKTPLAILLDGMYFEDEIDGEVSYTIVSDNYTTATTPGTYQVVLRGTDYSGNYRDQTITVRLTDGMPPILYITKNLLIVTDTVATLTPEQIIALVSQMENILNASIVVNNYTGNESTYGTYELIVQGTDSNGEVKMYSTSIYVRSSELNYYTVTFETNGGNSMDSIQVVELGQLIVQSPLKEGYTFVGWYKDEALTQQFSLVNDRITSDTTLYAKWSTGGGVVSPGENSISVTYEVLALVCILAVGLYLWKKKN